MSTNTYIVILNDPAHKDQFLGHMTSVTQMAHVPDRAVHCCNHRPKNELMAHFQLTADEAAALRADPRVEHVSLHIRENPNRHVAPCSTTQTSLFTTQAPTVDYHKNWGLLRSTQRQPVGNDYLKAHGWPYLDGDGAQANSLQMLYEQAGYTYDSDGTGVDIIIVDTGIAQDHPELAVNADGSGGSRVVDFDWTTLGVPGVVPCPNGSGTNGFLGDCDGHGSNCASIVAGNTCGWARGARIYSLRCIGSAYGYDIVNGHAYAAEDFIDLTLAFDLVKEFHLSKPLVNGARRPTICSNSWGTYDDSFAKDINQKLWTYTWRNKTTVNLQDLFYGNINRTVPFLQSFNYPSNEPAVDTAILQAMAAGVIVIAAAGNWGWLNMSPGDVDYTGTYYTDSSGHQQYIARGSTPNNVSGIVNGKTYKVISVGCLSATQGKDVKTYFSCCGTNVDLFAPGDAIAGAYGPVPYRSASARDSRNGNDWYFINKISGTSQACPQVAGALALACARNPSMDQIAAQQWLADNSTKDLMQDPDVEFDAIVYNLYGFITVAGYNLDRYWWTKLVGAKNRILYSPIGASPPTQGSVRLQLSGLQLNNIGIA
jgi:Subtilase family